VLDRLPSWREGDAKGAILAFVDGVTASGSVAFVPPAARIAVFDNDGTLWCERQTYPQAYFLLERLHAQAVEDPELAARPVVRALLQGDLRAAMAGGLEPLADVLLKTHAGFTAE